MPPYSLKYLFFWEQWKIYLSNYFAEYIEVAASMKIPTPSIFQRLSVLIRKPESPDEDENLRVSKNLSYIT